MANVAFFNKFPNTDANRSIRGRPLMGRGGMVRIFMNKFRFKFIVSHDMVKPIIPPGKKTMAPRINKIQIYVKPIISTTHQRYIEKFLIHSKFKGLIIIGQFMSDVRRLLPTLIEYMIKKIIFLFKSEYSHLIVMIFTLLKYRQ